MRRKGSHGTGTASGCARRFAVLVCALWCSAAASADAERDEFRETQESLDTSTNTDDALPDAPFISYFPFKSAASAWLPLKRVTQRHRVALERRGKGTTRSEVPEEPGRQREYLWEPYLFRDSPTDKERSTPNISTPGADTANFPNSAFTLPEGRFYFENSPIGYYGGSSIAAAQYNWELFYRYGVTDNLEFRLYTSGFTVVDSKPIVAGFSPVTFDLKYNLWEENPDYSIPAVGLEVYVQTTWGTAALNDGTQAAWSINVDHTLPFDIALEWNVGSTQIFDPRGENFMEENAAWSLQRDLTENVAVFIHGYHNAAGLPRGSISALNPVSGFRRINGRVYGAGAIWTVNERAQIFGSLNAGTETAPSLIALAGFALAF